MKKITSILFDRYRALLSTPNFWGSFALSGAFLIISLFVNYYAVVYATERASSAVTDIVLSNIPVFDVDGIFVWGPIVFWTVVSVYCLAGPKRIPFFLKSVSLFVVIRSAFVILTHIGPFPDRITIDPFGMNLLQDVSSKAFLAFFTGKDLFFSGHTGLPFLLALVFWQSKPMRYFCLFASIFFGTVVLLGHLHYSIDVLSAFFITYSIYHIAIRLFPKDKERFSLAG
jgi:hypothetical protein